MVKCTIMAELAQGVADLQAMEVEPPPDNLTEEQKNFWIEKQAEANAAKRALHELETQFITKRRCTSKTPQTEQVEFVPPDPTQGPSQASQVGKLTQPDIKNLIAHADNTAGLAKDAASRAFREEASRQTA